MLTGRAFDLAVQVLLVVLPVSAVAHFLSVYDSARRSQLDPV
jgi:hypothetical protein